MLFAAVTATLFRVFLPDIGMYRSEIEAWVSNYMDFPVAIRTLEADWHGWTPYLYLNNIDLLNKDGTRPIINFDSAQVGINLISTLMQRQIVPEKLILSGFDISLIRHIDGSIAVVGISTSDVKQQSRSNDELAEWLFGQRLIELQNARIEWVDEKLGQEPVTLTAVNLVLRSDGRRLQLEGSSTLPASYGDQLSFALDATGNLLTSDWSAKLYLQGSNVHADSWYSHYSTTGINMNGGNANIKMWSVWENAALVSTEGQLEYNDFSLKGHNGSHLDVQKLLTRFKGTKYVDQSWLLNFGIDQFITQNGSWLPSEIDLLVEPSSPRFTINFNYLKAGDVYPLLDSLSLLPANTLELITRHPFDVILSDGRLEFAPNATPDEKLHFDVTLGDLLMPATSSMPVISGLAARIRGSSKAGKVSFRNNNSTIEYSVAEAREVVALGINGDVNWTLSDDGYQLFTNHLQLTNESVVTQLTGSASLTNGCCYFDLVAETAPTSVDNFINSFPYTASFKLRDWLKSSVRNGELHSVKTLFRGKAKNFPFEDHTGVFELVADVSGASLDYSPKWPSIEKIDGQVAFAGRTMTITINKGTIFNAAIATATAVIPDLRPHLKDLNIDGQIIGITSDLKKYVRRSPLNTDSMLASLVNTLSDAGKVDLGLQLSISLHNPDKQMSVNGQLKLSGTTLTSDIENLKFTDINGNVEFTRDSLSAQNINARYNNNDVQLSVSGSKTAPDSPVTVAISGKGDNNFIIEQINQYFPGLTFVRKLFGDKITGSTGWMAKLTYTRDIELSAMKRVLQISSDLYGMNINLPQPLAKNAYTTTHLEINKYLDDPAQPLSIQYGNILSADIHLKPGSGLDRADINFGNTKITSIEHEGVLVTGRIDQMAVDEWMELLDFNKSDSEQERIALQTDLTFNNLYLFGHSFEDISVAARNDNSNWLFTLSGNSINGDITVPTGSDKEQPIVINLKNLYLRRTSGNSGEKKTNPADLRSITAKIDSFHYSDMDLGALTLVAGAADYGLYIDTLSFTKPSFTIEASGKWNGSDTIENSSDFIIQGHATEFNKMLETFGYDVAAVKKGETTLAIDANWMGSPMDFSLDKLNGTLALKIGKGQLLEVKPSAGRLFGLLSLQTLPRRLVLDFSDIFGDGMAFDLIEGDFVIKNGDAFTDNLVLKGPSVDIAITGRTGLSSHDYDQTAEVTPQISDSLAVASGFLGPMGIGLGTVLYIAGNLFEPLQNSINNILKFKYSITGSWNDPKIEKRQSDGKSSG